MFCFVKGIVKTAFWGTAILGALAVGTTLVAGPHQTAHVVDHIKSTVRQTIDDVSDNPVALRAQIERLQAEYPKRIRSVQKDLGELHAEAQRLRWEQAVSERVVEMAQGDLQEHVPMAQVQGTAAEIAVHASLGLPSSEAANRKGKRKGHRLVSNAKRSQVQRLENLVAQHEQTASDAARDLGYIEQEIERFTTLLTELETEQADYHNQLQTLNRQVDSIRRNERMLSMLRERQGMFDSASRFESHSLDQITGRLAGIRSQQEAEMELLVGTEMEVDYESRAKCELQWEDQTIEVRALSTSDMR